MKGYMLVILIFIFAMVSSVFSAEWVSFKGTITTMDGKPFMLKAKLSKPSGEGPFPAVIMMHCCGGSPWLNTWERSLIDWGYVTFRVDSLSPRNKASICGDPHIDSLTKDRSQDACDAKSYLLQQPYVDKENIGIIGWADGGMAAILTIDDETRPENLSRPFKAAIALYPRCSPIYKLNAPLLVLIGREDDWYPSERCEKFLVTENAPHEIILKIYDNAAHCFDWKGVNRRYLGHTLKYNHEAAVDAMVQVREFLSKHLK